MFRPAPIAAALIRSLLGLACCAALSISPLHAQPTTTPAITATPAAAVPTEAPDAAAAKALSDAEAKLAALGQLLNDADAAARGTTLADMQSAADKQRALVDELKRASGLAARLQGLKQAAGEVSGKLDALRSKGLSEKPPYSIDFYDKARDEAEARQRDLDNELLAAADLDQRIAQAADALAEAGRRRRAAGDAKQQTPSEAPQSAPEWRLEVAQIEESLAAARKSALDLEKQVATLDGERLKLEAGFARERADFVGARAVFSKQEFEKKLIDIDVARDRVNGALPKMRDQVRVSEARRADASEAMNGAKSQEESVLKSVELAAATAWEQARARAVELYEKDLALYDSEKELWRIRYERGLGGDGERLTVWRDQSAKILDGLKSERALQETRLADLRRQYPEVDKALADAANQPALKKAQENRRKAMTVREESLTTYLARVASTQAVAERTLAEIDRDRSESSWSERIAWLKRNALRLWGAEVLVVGDNAVTVRKIGTALLIMIIGLVLLRRFTKLLRILIFPWFGVSKGTGAAIQKLSYYILVVALMAFALKYAGIPLTLFAFLGGAIAVALGFGAQHIINNFISGIILLAERPIRVGDLIEYAGTFGIVEEVGARCTRLRTFANINYLIPNSALLQNAVVNWSLANHQVRIFMGVSVAPDSPVEKVMEVLAKAAADTKGVLVKPAPTVFVTDFTPSLLKCEVHFWIEMYSLSDRWKAESALRIHIISALKEAGIAMPAPPK